MTLLKMAAQVMSSEMIITRKTLMLLWPSEKDEWEVPVLLVPEPIEVELRPLLLPPPPPLLGEFVDELSPMSLLA